MELDASGGAGCARPLPGKPQCSAEVRMSIDALPPELTALSERLHAFLHDELLPAERNANVPEEAAAPDDLRRWVRRRANELGFFRLLQPLELGGDGLGALG